ncbi:MULTISPECIES: RNA methyltransferase [Myxococcus]|uniref:RNA methyltransferase, TrmH family n=1 Tax=Myxococcus xanthus (strain DK1622) TaxID=246197 RepID=Q1D9N7_MYXXD|nr:MULTISPECIES: TrmH family RNA methyltransferase [Myxococcus]ABF92230.1 RNA methyltransferase, TrmH family [Myxococcus xanthus DK 1622]NOJ53865.1 rRNA methyltransferase [Myxococcus xanthus]NOK07112.1 rRNA methyltransferase [Myxococcus xanthus]QPM81936.1 rRNA methyltransferase [Myxococcus xanthus]QVW71185.1 rRNA methyltransferase [Myxococcus xanthus DZ2]
MVLPVRFVLMRPRNAENLGAAARALKNCGLSDWVWVRPEVEDLEPARRLAVHAGDVLDAARRADTLEEAVADCVWVVGTSSRKVEGKRRLPPRAVGEELVARAPQGPVALVFGDERSGLTNAEVERVHDLSAVPTAPEQPSINLAQAVLLYAYEVRVAMLEAAATPPGPLPAAATDAELAQVESTLESVLTTGGFLVDAQPGRTAVRDLFAPLRRSRLTRKEARLWLAALHSLRKRQPAP